MLDKHYKIFNIEPQEIDLKHGLSYCAGSFLRYITRYDVLDRDNAMIEDLQKSLNWCLPYTLQNIDSLTLVQYPHGLIKSINRYCEFNDLNDFQKRVLKAYFSGLEYYHSLNDLNALELIYSAEKEIRRELRDANI